MNKEIELLESRVKPLVNQVAERQSIQFAPKSSEVLRQFYGADETARFIFESFVTASTHYQNCGGFVLTNAEQLEKLYSQSLFRRNELLENKLFAFALDGDGSFFAFGIESRKFYLFDFALWVGGELGWNECHSNEWNAVEFCCYFEEEYAENG